MSHFKLSTTLLVSSILASTLGLSACSTNYKVIKDSAVLNAPVIKTKAHSPSDKHAKWSYDGASGPDNWGNIEGAGICSLGKEQSPINITQVTVSSAKAPMFTYSKSADIKIKNNGHTIVYTPTQADNTVLIDGERYELKQFHYHIPSEHQIAGQNYPGEMHFVHTNTEGNLAVIGVMLKPGQSNDSLRVLLNGTGLTLKNDVEFTANNVDLTHLIPSNPTFYHYDGSLTTPPCSEKVQWYVTKQPLDISNDQFAVMYDLYDANNRPVQPQGERVVEQLTN